MGRRVSWRHDLVRNVPRSGRRAAGKVGGVCAAAIAVVPLSGCGSTGPGRAARLGLVDPASDRAVHMGNMWIGAWVAALVIGVFVWGLIGFAAFKFRRKDGDPAIPRQSRYHLPLEVLYTIVPFLVIGVLFFYTCLLYTSPSPRDS